VCVIKINFTVLYTEMRTWEILLVHTQKYDKRQREVGHVVHEACMQYTHNKYTIHSPQYKMSKIYAARPLLSFVKPGLNKKKMKKKTYWLPKF
jgi:hypothetical protein